MIIKLIKAHILTQVPKSSSLNVTISSGQIKYQIGSPRKIKVSSLVNFFNQTFTVQSVGVLAFKLSYKTTEKEKFFLASFLFDPAELTSDDNLSHYLQLSNEKVRIYWSLTLETNLNRKSSINSFDLMNLQIEGCKNQLIDRKTTKPEFRLYSPAHEAKFIENQAETEKGIRRRRETLRELSRGTNKYKQKLDFELKLKQKIDKRSGEETYRKKLRDQGLEKSFDQKLKYSSGLCLKQDGHQVQKEESTKKRKKHSRMHSAGVVATSLIGIVAGVLSSYLYQI